MQGLSPQERKRWWLKSIPGTCSYLGKDGLLWLLVRDVKITFLLDIFLWHKFSEINCICAEKCKWMIFIHKSGISWIPVLMYLCFVCIKSALGYFLRSVSSYHFKTSHSDTSSYANFRVRSWDTAILGELWWWMLGEEWPWQCVMLLYKQTDKTRVNKRTAGWGWGLHIPTHIHNITMLPKLHCHGNTILLGRSGLITILMSQNALFSLGQLRAVWKF